MGAAEKLNGHRPKWRVYENVISTSERDRRASEAIDMLEALPPLTRITSEESSRLGVAIVEFAFQDLGRAERWVRLHPHAPNPPGRYPESLRFYTLNIESDAEWFKGNAYWWWVAATQLTDSEASGIRTHYLDRAYPLLDTLYAACLSHLGKLPIMGPRPRGI